MLISALCALIGVGSLSAEPPVSAGRVTEEIEAVREEFLRRGDHFRIVFLQEGSPTLQGGTTLPVAKERLLERVRAIVPDIVDKITVYPTASLGDRHFGLITVSVANMRSSASHFSGMETQTLLGMPLRLLDKQGGWYYVITSEGYPCWVSGSSITPMTREEFNCWIEAPKVIYLGENGFALEKSRSDAARVSDLVAGCVFQLKGREGDFLEVLFPDGRTAFVSERDCLDFETWKKRPPPTADELTDAMKALMGVPYLWGGTSSKMLDCSGMTKYVFFLNGINLPRNASQQSKEGDPVDIEGGFGNLQKGDLIFFGSRAKEKTPERVTHVGVYLEDGLYIHESGRVRLNSFHPDHDSYDPALARSFLRARRYLGAVGKGNIVRIEEHPYYIGVR